MARVGSEEEPPPPYTKQVVATHQMQNAFVIDLPALANQFGMHAAIAVRRPAQGNLLDLVPHTHAGLPGFPAASKTIVSGAAHSGDLAEPIHAGLGFARFLDLLVDAAPPLLPTPRGCSLKRRKTFFKKSISMVCCPILRSSTAMRSLSSRAWGRAPLPGNASSPLARHSPFQVSNRLGLS